MSEELCQFLDYVNRTAAEGDFVRRLEEAVVRAKTMEEWRKEYMSCMRLKKKAERKVAQRRWKKVAFLRLQNL